MFGSIGAYNTYIGTPRPITDNYVYRDRDDGRRNVRGNDYRNKVRRDDNCNHDANYHDANESGRNQGLQSM